MPDTHLVVETGSSGSKSVASWAVYKKKKPAIFTGEKLITRSMEILFSS
jgi:hypothetical protein